MPGTGVEPRDRLLELGGTFLKLGTDLTIGKRGWRGKPKDKLFKLGVASKIICENINFGSLGVDPRTNEIEAGTSNPNQNEIS
jgi:hypothetical protein